MKIAKKILRNIITAIMVVVMIFVLDFVLLSVCLTIYGKDLKEGFSIYGLEKSFNPQGVAYVPSKNVILQTSFISKNSEAVLLVLDADSGNLSKELKIRNSNNTPYTKKASGIASDGKKVWITSDYEINEFTLDNILNNSTGSITSSSTNKLIIKGDFCYYENNNLWIGEYALKNFDNVKHDEALLMAFDTNNLNLNIPKTVVSLPTMVRGMIKIDDVFYVTRSFNNFINSSLVSYKILLGQESEFYSIEGKSIPYFHFDKDTIQNKHYLPPLAKGLYYKDDYISILFETGSRDYFYTFPKTKTYLRYKVK